MSAVSFAIGGVTYSLMHAHAMNALLPKLAVAVRHQQDADASIWLGHAWCTAQFREFYPILQQREFSASALDYACVYERYMAGDDAVVERFANFLDFWGAPSEFVKSIRRFDVGFDTATVGRLWGACLACRSKWTMAVEEIAGVLGGTTEEADHALSETMDALSRTGARPNLTGRNRVIIDALIKHPESALCPMNADDVCIFRLSLGISE